MKDNKPPGDIRYVKQILPPSAFDKDDRECCRIRLGANGRLLYIARNKCIPHEVEDHIPSPPTQL